MAIKDTFSKAAQIGATIFSDVFRTVTYYAEASTVYNVSAGTASSVASAISVSMLLSNYKKMEIDGDKVQPTDLKGFIPQANLTLSTPPKINHRIQVIEGSASVVYEIIDIKEDAAQAGWTFQLRKP
jgi:hypothetical protein